MRLQGCVGPFLRARAATGGGAGRDRTGDLLNANQALSQLSYSPSCKRSGAERRANALRKMSRQIGRGRARPARIAAENFSNKPSKRDPERMDRKGYRGLWQATRSPTPRFRPLSLRKEVIQPQVLLRLPCYDFTPIMNHTLGLFKLGLLVQSTFVM